MIEQIPIIAEAAWLKMRERDVTASVAGAVLGLHEYITPYGLWALKSGKILADDEETFRMTLGKLLEPIAVNQLRKLRPSWTINQPSMYYRDTGARLGATPDVIAIDPDRAGFGVVQIKTVESNIFRRKWLMSGTAEPPLWIAVQALVEAELTGAAWASVVPMRTDNGNIDIIDVPLHKPFMDRLKTEVAAFWRGVEDGRPPDPDLGRDGAIIEALYAPNGETIDLSSDNYLVDLVDERARIGTDKSAADKRRAEIRSELLLKLGTASAARLADGRLLTTTMVKRKGYTVKESEYLDLRIRKAIGDRT